MKATQDPAGEIAVRGAVAHRPVLIACDESGSDGENLVGGESRIFAHGSTDLDRAAAVQIIDHLRSAVKYQGAELKSAPLLKSASRRAELLDLFAPSGPLAGRAKVLVIDKAYMAAAKVIDLVIEEAAHASGIDLYADGVAKGMAMVLFQEGPGAFGQQRWQGLLGEFVSFVRRTQRKGLKTVEAELVQTIDELRRRRRRRLLAEVMAMLWEGREHLKEYSTTVDAETGVLGYLEPLWPSITAAVRAWHQVHGGPIDVLHDRQAALTPEAVATYLAAVRHRWPNMPPPPPITRLEQTDSRDDPRVQVADLVAGVGAWAANKALDGTLSEDEAQIIRPLLITDSMWGDPASWTRLAGHTLR